MIAPWKRSCDQPRQHIEKQRHYFANKGPSSESYGFSSSHVWMWELHYQESSAPKNWCFWIVVLEKTLENLLDCKEIQPVHLKEISTKCSLKGLMPKLKLQYFGHLMWRTDSFEKTLLLGWERLKVGREGMTEDEMVAQHHWFNGHEFEQAVGVGDGQGSLVL